MTGSTEFPSPMLPPVQQEICVFRSLSDGLERLGRILTTSITAVDSIGEEQGKYYLIFAGEKYLLFEVGDAIIVPSEEGNYWAINPLHHIDAQDPNPKIRLQSVKQWLPTSQRWTRMRSKTIRFKELSDAGLSLTQEELENNTSFVLEERKKGEWLIHDKTK